MFLPHESKFNSDHVNMLFMPSFNVAAKYSIAILKLLPTEICLCSVALGDIKRCQVAADL